MKRLTLEPRPNWQEKLEEQGFIWHSPDGVIYWDESAAYEFTAEQITKIETATAELHELYVQAGEDIVRRNLFRDYGVPEWAWPAMRKSWEEEPPALNYGRFDLGYDGTGEPKLFEFNADTPTSLYEASVIQWNWKEEVFDPATNPSVDQFNGIHEGFISRWAELKPHLPDVVYFTASEDPAGEDIMTTTYMGELAHAGGLTCEPILIQNVGWNEQRRMFTDMDENEIKAIYKLYPWEWMLNEEFGQNIPRAKTIWIEPMWKMLWSNKRILAHLWEMFPDHPNLLRAQLTQEGLTSYAAKPNVGREGAGITIVDKGRVLERAPGDAGTGDQIIYQQLYSLPLTQGGYPVIGSWSINGTPVGMGIREAGLITDNKARFIPHIIR